MKETPTFKESRNVFEIIATVVILAVVFGMLVLCLTNLPIKLAALIDSLLVIIATALVTRVDSGER